MNREQRTLNRRGQTKGVHVIVAPDLFILGGGLSKRYDEYKHLITANTPIRVAALKNNAGIVGAAAAVK